MLKWSREVARKLSGGRLNRGVRLKSSLCEIFHENTKLTPLSQRSTGVEAATFAKSKITQKLVAAPYKVYSLVDRQTLPTVVPQGQFEAVIAKRRTIRRFSREPVALIDLARLLHMTYGRLDQNRAVRPVASGGALYPLEFYVTAINVDGLRAGVYHYDVENHCLDVIRHDQTDFERLREIMWLDDIETVENTGLIIYISAFLQRTTAKYGDRGYRLVLIEAGEAVHNLALLACQMDLACCPLGGFLDNPLSAYLEVDGVDEVPLVPMVFGRRDRGGIDT